MMLIAVAAAAVPPVAVCESCCGWGAWIPSAWVAVEGAGVDRDGVASGVGVKIVDGSDCRESEIRLLICVGGEIGAAICVASIS